MRSCAAYTSHGYCLGVMFISLRASNCVATTQGQRLFEEILYASVHEVFLHVSTRILCEYKCTTQPNRNFVYWSAFVLLVPHTTTLLSDSTAHTHVKGSGNCTHVN